MGLQVSASVGGQIRLQPTFPSGCCTKYLTIKFLFFARLNPKPVSFHLADTFTFKTHTCLRNLYASKKSLQVANVDITHNRSHFNVQTRLLHEVLKVFT